MEKNEKDDALFQAILDDDRAAVSRLKERGVTLTGDVKYALTHDFGTRIVPMEHFIIRCSFQVTIQQALRDGQLDLFVSVMRNMREAVGEPLPFSGFAVWKHTANFYDPAVFECILDCFDNRKIDKKQCMLRIIDMDRVEALKIAIERGWLKQPKKRDEMIEYAKDRGRTEIVAYLLDYKNRAFDLVKEREEAEKKMLRELNANPNSVTELKKIWRYEKQEDGTLIITGYKGDRTEIAIPEKIGKSTVTAIGRYAFSPKAPRLREEQAVNRCRITKIIVPPSVRTIGKYAFGWSGWVPGNFNASPLLEEVILPDTLEMFADKKAAENAPIIFVNCPKLTVKIPHSPYAEIFCRKNKVNYIFTEVNNEHKTS